MLETREVIWGWELSFTLVWLVVILSFVATNLYYFMLRRGEAARVSGLFYLTPPTAVVLGYLTYGETFGVIAILGFGVAAAGVALLSRVVPAAWGRWGLAASAAVGWGGYAVALVGAAAPIIAASAIGLPEASESAPPAVSRPRAQVSGRQ